MAATNSGYTSAHIARKLALPTLVLFACAAPALVLLGWLVENALLRGLGSPGYPISPLAALIFLTISLSAAAEIYRLRRVSRSLLGLAFLWIGLVSLHYVAGPSLGLDRLLFPDQVGHLHVSNDGIPGVGAATILFIDCLALILTSGDKARQAWAVSLASAAFALTLLTMSITLIQSAGDIDPAFIGRSTASAFPNLALTAAIVLLASGRASVDQRTLGWSMFRQLAPAIIILPTAPSILALLAIHAGLLGANGAHFVTVAGNVGIVATLLLHCLLEAGRQNKALAAREKQLTVILEAIPDAIVVTGRDGAIVGFSAAAERLWGVARGEVVGRNFATLVTDIAGGEPGDPDGRDEIRNDRGAWRVQGTRRDGAPVPLELRIVPAREEGDFLVHRVRDMTAQVEEEDQLAELSFQLAHLSRLNAMGNIAADLAHELNQPLTAASNFLATFAILMRNGGDRGTQDDLISQAREQVARAGEIIRRMRAFTERREVEKQAEALKPLIEDAARLVLVGSGRFGVRIDYDLDPPEPHVFVDRVQVQQVVVNLLRNALDAIRADEAREARIVISTRASDNDQLKIIFRDNGPGIPPNLLDQLFQRYWSSGKTGMGIGLAISRQIIEAHGGTIWAENSALGGAEFHFTLPRPLGNRAEVVTHS